jgi:hypothetical protein
MKTYTYRDYRIDLHPYAGGFKAFIFSPYSNGTGAAAHVVVGPDGGEDLALDQVLRDSKLIIDSQHFRQAA